MAFDLVESLKYNHGDGYDRQIKWIQNLCYKNYWKPNKEDLKSLEFVINYHEFADSQNKENLESLFKQLKEL